MSNETLTSVEEEETLQDMKQKYVIVKKLLDICEEKKHETLTPKPDLLNKLKIMTGVPESWFEKYKPQNQLKRTTNLKIHKKYLKYLKFTQICSATRDLVVKFYVQHSVVPTLADLNQIFQQDDRNLNKMLRDAGFKWERLHETSKCILVEDYKHTYKRRKYLKAMLQFRSENKSFVYVHRFVNNIESAVFYSSETLCIYLEFPELQKLDKDIYRIFNVYNPSSTVFVINEHPLDDLKLKGIPALDASKSEITSWLDRHDIPYDRNMLKFELHKIIETFQKNVPPPQPAIQLILESKGYTVIYQPMGYLELSIFYKATSLFGKGGHFECSSELITHLKKHDLAQWDAYEGEIALTEQLMLEEDTKLEEICDSILTMAKYSKVTREDIEDLQDTDMVITENDNNNILDK